MALDELSSFYVLDSKGNTVFDANTWIFDVTLESLGNSNQTREILREILTEAPVSFSSHVEVVITTSDNEPLYFRLEGLKQLEYSSSLFSAGQAQVTCTVFPPLPLDMPIIDARVEAGDHAILEVDDAFFYEVRHQLEYSLIRRLHGYRVQRIDKAVTAAGITLAMVLLAAFDVMSMLNASLLALLAMLLTGCLTLERAWRSIEWKTLVVLGAAIGLESAITATGLSQAIADVLSALGGDSPFANLVIVFIGAIVMTNIITNAAVAAFIFPVALSMANNLEVSFMPFAMILMLGTSYAFINPTGYQTNLMVQAPGNYKFMDFVRIGVPLTILTGLVALLLAPIVYGF